MPQRIQLRRTKGWRLPENTVVVSRPSRWGNPFSVAELGRGEALRRYRERLAALPADELAALLAPLHGKNLACWCRPGEECHADILLALANPE